MAHVALSSGFVFQPSGPELVGYHLVPKAGLGGRFFPGQIEEGVDVFSRRPRALPFWPNHRKEDGEVWGFFFAARPAAGKTCPAPGGCWVRYGREMAYYRQDDDGGEAVAFLRKFKYRFTWKDGKVWAPTRWRMEYRLNTDAAAFRAAHPDPDPEAAGVVFVVHKVFRKPLLPPPRPPPVYCSESEDECSDCPRDEELHELVIQLRALTEGK